MTLNLTRRGIVAAAGFGLAAPFMGGFAAQSPKKIVVVVCRGGMDGLSVSPPVGDADYAGLRGQIALNEGALKLDSTFALHPALTSTYALAQAGQARIIPAVATPDRARSHFEAQDVLETGAAQVYAAPSGWLNRTVEALSRQGQVGALSVGPTAPLILRGPTPTNSWSPGSLLNTEARLPTLLQDLYKNDPLLGPALARGLQTEVMAQAAMTGLSPPPAARAQAMAPAQTAAQQAQPQPMATPAAQAQAAQKQGQDAARKLGATVAGFMREPNGPSIVALSLDGFDTHANQGAATGQLATRLAYLDAVLDGLHTGLGDAWKDTTVVVATEFGRTARVNGTGGTDHGTASTALLLGGALKPGGGIVGDWPSLKQQALFENRDLAPTLDMRGVFKGLLADHMGVDPKALETTIFPNSAQAAPTRSLV
jgi:uncharacterized protein (DUF1501 family)